MELLRTRYKYNVCSGEVKDWGLTNNGEIKIPTIMEELHLLSCKWEECSSEIQLELLRVAIHNQELRPEGILYLNTEVIKDLINRAKPDVKFMLL